MQQIDSQINGATGGKLCCEQYLLKKFGMNLSAEGLAGSGLCVSRRYHATLNDIRKALEQGDGVMVAVDRGELVGNDITEAVEDRFCGEKADHFICILSLEDDILAYDPGFGEEARHIERERFIDAWRDSGFHMVTANRLETVAGNYTPAPLDLSDVILPDGLNELTEAIAENTHEVWSKGRMDEGWSYGPKRDDQAKTHPDLLPYSALTEGEKAYDRATAISAIKLIVKLGYKIEKR